jgi:UDP-3-O-acyl-N-acetylglucosamine deacetylase
MDRDFDFGQILDGDKKALQSARNRFQAISVDEDWSQQEAMPAEESPKTIAKSVTVSAPGTFAKNRISTLQLEPSQRAGWWFDRVDLPDSQPIKVSSRNVWTTGKVVSNIVLRSGSAHNYARLVEHIIALKAGMDVDNLLIRMESGDPPLFNTGSEDLVAALKNAGRKSCQGRIRYLTVKEPATMATPHGGFTTVLPAKPGDRSLHIDCARDFTNAIGQQRIRFVLNDQSFYHGSKARTNATWKQMMFIRIFGKLFADVRNIGYNKNNILIAAKTRYVNAPTHMVNGKSLEAAWHRAILDLVAALALIEEGRFVGSIIDYKGNHFADVELVKLLYANDLLVEA